MQVLNNTDVQVGLDSNGRPNVAVVPKTPRPAAIQAQVRYTNIPDCLAWNSLQRNVVSGTLGLWFQSGDDDGEGCSGSNNCDCWERGQVSQLLVTCVKHDLCLVTNTSRDLNTDL